MKKEEDRIAFECSVVMPCLNEEDTLGICLEKARRALTEHGIDGEIIVADNGSTDRSLDIAAQAGARIVHVPCKGYGHALMGGIAVARGRYIIMGDADDSYDFLDIPKFVDKLRAGADLVMGCRLPSGGGTIEPGAMPFLHQWLGNPMFTAMARLMFKAPIHDIYCGLRGFTRAHYDKLDQRCIGMEFATEMVIKSSLMRAAISEVPITLHPDGRRAHKPHLKTFSDGWRTLRFFMFCSPTCLFFIPGAVLMLLGFVGYVLALPGIQVFGATLGAHTLLVSSLLILMGYQGMLFAGLATIFAIGDKLLPPHPRMMAYFNVFNLERGLLLSFLVFLTGLGLLSIAFLQWWRTDFGLLDYARTMRLVIPGVTLAALGYQSFIASFFASILGLHRT